MTIFLTVVSGVSVFVLGQIVLEFLVKPALALRTTTGEICQTLHRHAGVICNPQHDPANAWPETSAVRDRMRDLAGEFYTRVVLIPKPFYWLLSLTRLAPTRAKTPTIHRYLVYMSSKALGEFSSGDELRIAYGEALLQLGMSLDPESDRKSIKASSQAKEAKAQRERGS